MLTTSIEFNAEADLVASIHAPWQATVAECLDRWAAMGPGERSQSYLVLRGNAGVRRTLNGAAIAELARQSGRANQHGGMPRDEQQGYR